MDRNYKVIATRRDGVGLYWEPAVGQFTYKEIPTNRYHEYLEAHREYRKAVDLADQNDIASVSLLEHREKDDTWYTLTWIELEREDEPSAESIMIDIGTARLSMKTTSAKLREIAELSKLSRETREEIERISDKLHSLAELTWNLQEKVLEELE